MTEAMFHFLAVFYFPPSRKRHKNEKLTEVSASGCLLLAMALVVSFILTCLLYKHSVLC